MPQPPSGSRARRLGRALLRATLASLTIGIVWLVVQAGRIGAAAEPFIAGNASALPKAKVGLVLGCSRRMPDGRANLFFEKRIAAAAALLRSGKVEYLLVSGDNSRASYDEPNDMRRALESAGVAPSKIVLDHAGFRTLDSVVRAKEVFGLTRLIVVSQHFHNVRAVYLARAHGIEAFGFDAAAVGGPEGFLVGLREVASRLFAVLDVKVLHTTPRYPGPPEPTPFSATNTLRP